MLIFAKFYLKIALINIHRIELEFILLKLIIFILTEIKYLYYFFNRLDIIFLLILYFAGNCGEWDVLTILIHKPIPIVSEVIIFILILLIF